MSMKETPISGEAIIKAEEAKMMGTSGVEAGSFENNQSNKEDPFAVGRARQDAIAAALKATKEKVGGWFSRASSSIGKFFKKDAIPAVLQTDVYLNKGADALVDKAEAFDRKTDQQAYEAGVGMGKGIAEGYHNVKDKVEAVGNAMNKGGDAVVNWADKKGDQLNKAKDDAVEYISDKVLRGGDATVEAFKNVAKWTDEKMTATADFLSNGEALLADKMLALSEKTGKSIDKFKGGVANQFNNIKKFGENSWMSAKMRVAEIKQNRRDRKNEKLRLAAEAKYNAEIAQLQADLENNKQGEEWAKNQAEAYRKNQEIIQAKLDHMTNVENLFNSQAAA